jgi:hypothetical protein
MVRTCLLLAAALAMSSSAVARGGHRACGGFCDIRENTRSVYRPRETQGYGSRVKRGKAAVRRLDQRQQSHNARSMQE